MGEWSKSVGEKGEQIVEYFFKSVLGYDNILYNESIKCNKGVKHKDKTSQGPKTTHGIDALIGVSSPLEDKLLDVMVISSKFTSKIYPNSPKSIFKEHLSDLAYTIECFKNSKLFSQLNQSFSNVSRTEITGILVWASNKSSLNESIISKVSNIQIDSEVVFDQIIVIDNDRINFFSETVAEAKKEFGSDNVKFVYHNTSLNKIGLQSTGYGSFLPTQYLFSDIIPLRIDNKGEIEFLIYTKENFSSESFSKLLDFVKNFDHLNTTHKIILSFPDFNSLEHDSIIKAELFKFSNYNYGKNLIAKKHSLDFRNY